MDNALLKTKKSRWFFGAGLAIIAAIAAVVIYYFVNVYATQKKVDRIIHMVPPQLVKIFDAEKSESISGYNIYILAAFAQNKNATGRMLGQIARMQNPELTQHLTTFFASLKGQNKDGVSVKQLVARNPNVSPRTLAYLANSKNTALLCEIARNKKTLILTLEKLATSKDKQIRQCVAMNKHAPKPLLRKLRETKQYLPVFGFALMRATHRT